MRRLIQCLVCELAFAACAQAPSQSTSMVAHACVWPSMESLVDRAADAPREVDTLDELARALEAHSKAHGWGSTLEPMPADIVPPGDCEARALERLAEIARAWTELGDEAPTLSVIEALARNGDHERALELLRSCPKLGTESSERAALVRLWRVRELTFLGRFDEALREFAPVNPTDESAAREPRSNGELNVNCGFDGASELIEPRLRALVGARRFDEAVALARDAHQDLIAVALPFDGELRVALVAREPLIEALASRGVGSRNELAQRFDALVAIGRSQPNDFDRAAGVGDLQGARWLALRCDELELGRRLRVFDLADVECSRADSIARTALLDSGRAAVGTKLERDLADAAGSALEARCRERLARWRRASER